LFRIAFQAQEKYGTLQGVKILPVGYDYGHYTHFRTTLLVTLANPLTCLSSWRHTGESGYSCQRS
jgi:hypothetical protein